MTCETNFTTSSNDETGMDLFDIFNVNASVDECQSSTQLDADCVTFGSSALVAHTMTTASMVLGAGFYLGHFEKGWVYKSAFGTRRRITKVMFVNDSICFAK